MLVQISRKRLEDNRVPRGQEPVFEMDLEDHERIVAIDGHVTLDYESRQTVDHSVRVWVASYLGDSDAP
jgi:hypothetical protein